MACEPRRRLGDGSLSHARRARGRVASQSVAYPQRVAHRLLCYAGDEEQRDCLTSRHHRTGGQELSSQSLRQAGSRRPTGTGALLPESSRGRGRRSGQAGRTRPANERSCCSGGVRNAECRSRCFGLPFLIFLPEQFLIAERLPGPGCYGRGWSFCYPRRYQYQLSSLMKWGIGGSRAFRGAVRIKTIASQGAGEMAEWRKAHAWKACLLERVTWVRIPLSPPYFQ